MPANNAIERKTVAASDEIAKDRCLFGITKGAVNEADRTVAGVASSIHVDRHGEVVLPSALAGDLRRFLQTSAPFLAAHMHRSESGEPMQIGWIKEASVVGDELRTVFQFAKTSVAEEWWTLASDPNGKGIAFSIGFLPKEYSYGQVRDLVREFPALDGVFKAAGLKPDDRSCVYTKLELLEISGCPVGSNRQSLQERMERFFSGNDSRLTTHDSRSPSDSPITNHAVEAQLKGLQTQITEVREEILASITELFDRIETASFDEFAGGAGHRHAPGEAGRTADDTEDRGEADPVRAAAQSLSAAISR